MSILAALSVYGDEVITSNAILFTTATAASINLTCIFLFNWVIKHLLILPIRCFSIVIENWASDWYTDNILSCVKNNLVSVFGE